MSSDRSYLLTALFIAFLLLQAQHSVQAQNVYIVVSSSITYDAATNKVNGISQTSMDYRTNLYYQARAKGYIYTQNLNSPLAVSDRIGTPGQSVVSAQTQATASPYTTYNLKTEHFLHPLYCEAYCSYYLDYYNYYYSSPSAYPWNQSEFGSTQTIYGCNPGQYQTCYPNVVYSWIWMGNTNTSTVSPPSLSITNPRVSGNLKGTSQNVLLASPAGLQATVTPAGLGGNFVWSFTGPFTQHSAAQDNSYRSIFWTQPGTYAATVTYSGSGFSVSGTVNVQVRVPTLTSFSGIASNTVVNRGSNCGAIFDGQYLPFGTTVSMGCSLLQDGMVYSATATIPNLTYLSDPANTGIIFKQIFSGYRKRNNQGRFECLTSRNPQSDPTTGWQIDAIEGQFYSPGVTFSNATTITHEESDLPGSAVSGRHNDGGAPFEYEAFLADDPFETYVYYFTGNPGNPSFSIPLHVADAGCPADRFDCGVDLLAWRFGPQVHYDSSIQNSQYRLVMDNSTVGSISATRRPSVRSYSVQQTNQYSLCQGAPDVTNPIDGTRFFVLQLYWDVLGRTADQNGWDGWTTIIASCGFNTACINSNRLAVARGFLESPENFANNPALANPGSHEYNREYVRLCYLKFLGRPPDQPYWDDWTHYINTHPGEYSNLVGGFINSTEYRGRFGTP
ncbi:MAG: hypothetical protein AABN95_22825 [Acidobacteriota bacterium]